MKIINTILLSALLPVICQAQVTVRTNGNQTVWGTKTFVDNIVGTSVGLTNALADQTWDRVVDFRGFSDQSPFNVLPYVDRLATSSGSLSTATNYFLITNASFTISPIGAPGVGVGYSNLSENVYLGFDAVAGRPITEIEITGKVTTNWVFGDGLVNGCYGLGLNFSIKANNIISGNAINISDNHDWIHCNWSRCAAFNTLVYATNGFNAYAGPHVGWSNELNQAAASAFVPVLIPGERQVIKFRMLNDVTCRLSVNGVNSVLYSSQRMTNLFWPNKTNSFWVELLAFGGTNSTNRNGSFQLETVKYRTAEWVWPKGVTP